MFERYVIAVEAVRATPVLSTFHHIVRIELIGEIRDTDSQPKTRICRLGLGIKILLIEVINIRQTIGIGAESVHEVLARLVEIATTFYAGGNHQAIRPVAVTQIGTVIRRILHGPQTLFAILILRFGTEVIMEILLQSIATGGIDILLGIGDHFLQIILVDLRHSM